MDGWRAQKDGRFAMAVLLALLAALHTLWSQQAPPPALDDILQRLEANLHQYEATVPSFFADEHVISQVEPTVGNHDAITEATFRLKRIANPDHTMSLSESRDLKTINGKPASTDDLVGPVVLKGAFSGGLAIVSRSQEACMRYKMRPNKPNHPDDPYIIQFESTFDPRHPGDCILQEDGEGRVLIDSHTMQIKRMELTAPNHIIFPATTDSGRSIPAVVGIWNVSVDYAPVLLGGQTFWLPSTIESSASNRNPARFGPSFWSFKARYSNYHKLEVTSRILLEP